jgi:hypothetical protein
VLIKCDASHKNWASFRNKITNKIAGYPQTLAFTIVATNIDSKQNSSHVPFAVAELPLSGCTCFCSAVSNISDRHEVSESVFARFDSFGC